MSSEDELRRELAELEAQIQALRRRLGEAFPREDRPAGRFAVLVCRVEGESVALELEDVDEVVPMARLSPIPEADAWVAGLLDLGGQHVPVVDVAARLERTPRRPLTSDLIVVGRARDQPVGLLVQQVVGVHECEAEEVQDVSADMAYATYVRGVLTVESASCLFLSIVRLANLPDQEFEEAAAR